MPQAPFLAMITPLAGETQPPQPPLGIWGPSDPRPTLPIAGWNPGTGTWPTPPLPGTPPPVAGWPIVPGWGGSLPGGGGFPGQGGPVDPGYSPPWAQVPPGQGPGPLPPLVIWGPGDPRPTLPIAGWNPITGNFPELPAEIPDLGPVEWKAIWTPQTGWAVIGIPTGPTPTPSKTA